MPLGSLIIIAGFAMLSAFLARRILLMLIRRVPQIWVQVLTAIMGAVCAFFCVLWATGAIFDRLYPFVPSEPNDVERLLWPLYVLGQIGGALQTMGWSINAGYTAAAAWSVLAFFTIWQNWRTSV